MRQGLVTHVLLGVRAGFSAQEILETVRVACEVVPKIHGPACGLPDCILIPAHALTVWRSNTAYMHKGKPRALPLRGPAPSVESLIRLVDPTLDVEVGLDTILTSKSLRRTPHGYLPRTAGVLSRGSPCQPAFLLRGIHNVLANADHNSVPLSSWPSWYSLSADCPKFPRRDLEASHRYIWAQSEALLQSTNDYMRHHEVTVQPGEATVQMGLAIFQYQENSNEHSKELTEMLVKVRQRLGPLPSESLQPTSSSYGRTRKRQRRRPPS